MSSAPEALARQQIDARRAALEQFGEIETDLKE